MARPARHGIAGGLLLALAWTAAACTDAPSNPSAPPSSHPQASAEVLPLGKSDLSLAPGSYRSPEGFRPGISLVVPQGWSSVHRGSDGFDLGRPDPERDAPEVAVVFLASTQKTAAEALARVTRRPSGWTKPRAARIGGLTATSADLVGGRGQVVASPSGGIALDAAPGQRMRVYAVDVAGAPLLVVVLVPDGGRWRDLLPDVEALLGSVAAV